MAPGTMPSSKHTRKSHPQKRKSSAKESGERVSDRLTNKGRPIIDASNVEISKVIETVDASEEDDEDDDELLAAAATWATESDKPDKSNRRSNEAQQSKLDTSPQHQAEAFESRNQKWSLHVTQLSFEATDFEIREAFVQKGCLVSSVRLVYDRDGNHRTFRGVAFVDVTDEPSYRKALELDRKVLMGRKINVRPTRTKSELAGIVERTKDIVAEKIKTSKELQDKDADDNDVTKSSRKRKSDKNDRDPKRRKVKDHDALGKSKSEPAKNRAKADDKRTKLSSNSKPRSTKETKTKESIKPKNGKSELPKLSKKERNRRAAILMSKEPRTTRK